MKTPEAPKKLPTVGIIIANYNYGHFIKDAINSVLVQDYPEIITVIVNDGSTDNSLEQILSFTEDKNIVEHNPYGNVYKFNKGNRSFVIIDLNKNSGVSNARNIGIQYIWNECQLFQIADADDILLPAKISTFVAKFLESPDILGGVYADYLILNEQGYMRYECKKPYDFISLTQSCIIHSGSMLNKLALNRVGLFDTNLNTAEDYCLFLQISQYFIFHHVATPLTIVRSHKNDTTSQIPPEQWNRNLAYVRQKVFGKI